VLWVIVSLCNRYVHIHGRLTVFVLILFPGFVGLRHGKRNGTKTKRIIKTIINTQQLAPARVITEIDTHTSGVEARGETWRVYTTPFGGEFFSPPTNYYYTAATQPEVTTIYH